MLPMGIQIVVMIQVASKRASAYLQLPEQPSPAPVPPATHEAALVAFEGATICWPKPEAVSAAKALAAVRAGKSGGKGASKGARRTAAGGAQPESLRAVSASKEDQSAKGGALDKKQQPGKEEHPDKPTTANGSSAVVEVVRELSLSVAPSSLVALVGPVSAGKTSLLAAIWGEASISRGSLTLTGQVAVVPQRPFTIGGTVLDNILLGRPFDAELLQDVLEGCALMDDLDALPMREMTEVRAWGRGLLQLFWFFGPSSTRLHAFIFRSLQTDCTGFSLTEGSIFGWYTARALLSLRLLAPTPPKPAYLLKSHLFATLLSSPGRRAWRDPLRRSAAARRSCPRALRSSRAPSPRRPALRRRCTHRSGENSSARRRLHKQWPTQCYRCSRTQMQPPVGCYSALPEEHCT
jgi:energy-coupling factor transporter ATP-binding protein EcfA2